MKYYVLKEHQHETIYESLDEAKKELDKIYHFECKNLFDNVPAHQSGAYYFEDKDKNIIKGVYITVYNSKKNDQDRYNVAAIIEKEGCVLKYYYVENDEARYRIGYSTRKQALERLNELKEEWIKFKNESTYGHFYNIRNKSDDHFIVERDLDHNLDYYIKDGYIILGKAEEEENAKNV